jgi:uncharacterized membrane protein
MLLAPWWVRMAYTFVVVAALALGGVWFARLEGATTSLPWQGVALILLVCLAIAALLVALSNQTRPRYVEALEPVTTAAERTEAIRAARRGPIPENPRVRDAARRLAVLYSAPPGRNRRLTIVGYVAMAIVFPLNVVTALVDDKPVRAALFAVLGLIVVWGAVQERRTLRRAKDRVRQLAAA